MAICNDYIVRGMNNEYEGIRGCNSEPIPLDIYGENKGEKIEAYKDKKEDMK